MNDGTLTFVLLAGLSRSGKTTLALELSNRLHWRHIEKDKYGIGGPAYEKAFACVREELLTSRASVILDSSALYEDTIRNALNIVATIPNVQLKVILCFADQKLREKRSDERGEASASDNIADNEYLLHYKHLPNNKLKLSTDQPLNECVDEAIKYLMESRYN